MMPWKYILLVYLRILGLFPMSLLALQCNLNDCIGITQAGVFAIYQLKGFNFSKICIHMNCTS